MTALTLSNLSAATVPADAVVIGVAKGESGPVLAAAGAPAAAVDAATGGTLAATLTTLGAKGGELEITKLATPEGVAAPLLVAVGLGAVPEEGAAFDPERLRRAAGAAARALAGSAHAAFALPLADTEAVTAVAEGALLGAYRFTAFRGRDFDGSESAPPGQVTVLDEGAADDAHTAAVERALVVAEEVARARDLINTPPDALTPAEFAARATEAAPGYGVDVTVWEEEALAEGGFGGLIGVGRGSANPPRLVRLAYRNPAASRTLALVGKGITYDSGGISLKPAGHNETMKCDMSGAAAVYTAVLAAARLGLPVNITGWLALAENMPSGSATKPGDVLSLYGGKTVEVLNTDAEGRLVLGDALVRACEEEPDAVVDVATLTGAMVVALGERTMGVLGTDEFRDLVHETAVEVGEPSWPMPMPTELAESLKSVVADLPNVAGRMGGGLLAGVFLREFVPADLRWAHLDIAGPAYNDGSAYGYTPKGGTGFAVRTLVRLAERAADGDLG
ncbi:leucyl aminopeptidase [Streptomyces sp. DSM 44915]|uniref:Probable cytosol aminopeptidase n=1 Tax=Streptomyces chisholmiae TaxID=3075540 RepID=A0ABU2JIU4_9ACTN|nr:leucyl aminopeptidase [Streptomyces sp. DSM 44915]MDT0264905.1 leucyl aminopeptidase [Streptomyces sp. DSM 44915]